jgi:hypothetical protein
MPWAARSSRTLEAIRLSAWKVESPKLEFRKTEVQEVRV